jgi:hypothetical protein
MLLEIQQSLKIAIVKYPNNSQDSRTKEKGDLNKQNKVYMYMTLNRKINFVLQYSAYF